MRATRRAFRRVAAVAVTLLVAAACSSGDDSAPHTIPQTVSPSTVETTTSASAPTNHIGFARDVDHHDHHDHQDHDYDFDVARVGDNHGPVGACVDASTPSTLDLSHRFDFEAPATDPQDLPWLDIYRNFMAVQEQALLQPSDPDRRAALAAITTSRDFAASQQILDDLVATGRSYQVLEPATYHPFVEYGDAYRDDFRTVAGPGPG